MSLSKFVDLFYHHHNSVLEWFYHYPQSSSAHLPTPGNMLVYIQKTKIMASSSITSWQIDEETVEIVADFFFFLAPRSLQMVTAAMKLKDTYSLEEKLWPT